MSGISVHTCPRQERGAALPLAIFALIVIGALVAAAFWIGTQDHRVADTSRRSTQSFGVAESGISEVVRLWNPALNSSILRYPLDSAPVSFATTGNQTGSYGGYIYKLNGTLYLADITGLDTASRAGRVQHGGARQRLGMLLRTRPINVVTRAAMVTWGDVKLKDNAIIDGNDRVPAGWSDCPPLDTAIVGLRSDSASSIKVKAPAQVLGNPPQKNDLGAADTLNMTKTFDSLAAHATLTIPGGSYLPAPALDTLGRCKRSVVTNWGDPQNPTAPCGGYFPIIHVTGDLSLTDGQGQGILLIDGKLDVKGGFKFYGIIMAVEQVKLKGAGGQEPGIVGTIMSLEKNKLMPKDDSISTFSSIAYSKCAILRSMQGSSIVTPLRSRSWSQLF